MSSGVFVLIGILLGIATVIYGIAISYGHKKKFLNEIDVYLTNVENELLENIRDIGLSGLRETPTGRELFSLLSKKELMILSRDSRASTSLVHASGLAKSKKDPASEQFKSYLALFSIPIYGAVEAGPDGELHIDHFDTYTEVNKVILQGQVFDLHHISRNRDDREIPMMSGKTYGWLRVHGLSMNGWGIPFDENDYVLFYRTLVAEHLDYVIASNQDLSGEMALIVKRFDEKNNQLLSKSKDTSKSYGPIPLDEDHQIVGIVIAVAKPTQ
jgi:hypothetical protein